MTLINDETTSSENRQYNNYEKRTGKGHNIDLRVLHENSLIQRIKYLYFAAKKYCFSVLGIGNVNLSDI